MCQTVDECSEMMGETGQGMKSEDKIKTELNNNLTRSWGECCALLEHRGRVDPPIAEVKKKCPWYFTLKGLISECPNMVPVGLGNNATEYDTSILQDQRGGANARAEAGPSSTKGDMLDSDELKDTAKDQEVEDDLKSFNEEMIRPSSPDTKPAVKGKNIAIKKETLGARGGVLTQYITNTLQGNGQRTYQIPTWNSPRTFRIFPANLTEISLA
jgi:hypothetical protein